MATPHRRDHARIKEVLRPPQAAAKRLETKYTPGESSCQHLSSMAHARGACNKELSKNHDFIRCHNSQQVLLAPVFPTGLRANRLISDALRAPTSNTTKATGYSSSKLPTEQAATMTCKTYFREVHSHRCVCFWGTPSWLVSRENKKKPKPFLGPPTKRHTDIRSKLQILGGKAWVNSATPSSFFKLLPHPLLHPNHHPQLRD